MKFNMVGVFSHPFSFVVMALTDAMGAVISGGLSAAGGLASGILSMVSGKKDREAYENQQQLNRIFENEQAAKAYGRQIEFWKMQNEYNSPAQQVQRLAAAGLNPDLAVSGAVNNTSAPLSSVAKGSATGASFAPPIDTSAFANAAHNAANTVKAFAEAKKTKVEADNVQLDSALKQVDLQFKPYMYKQQLQLGSVEIELKGANVVKTKQETTNLQQELANLAVEGERLKQSIEESKAKVALLNQQAQTEIFTRVLKSKEFELEVKKFHQFVKESNSRIHLNETQAGDILATQAYRVLGLKLDNKNKIAQRHLINSQTISEDLRHLGIDYQNDAIKLDVEYNEVRNQFQPFNGMMSSLRNVLGIFTDFIPGAPGAPSSAPSVGVTTSPAYSSSSSW